MCVNKFNCQNVYVGNEENWLITGWVNIKEEYYSCYIDIYNHYNNRLKQKINLLNKSNNTIKESYLKLQQKMASSCLELPSPVSGNRGETDPYLSKVMFCLIQNYKQEITNIEKQLAH